MVSSPPSRYGYPLHVTPDTSTFRLIISGDEVRRYMAAFPQLSQQQVIDAMIETRPSRARLEERLRSLAGATK